MKGLTLLFGKIFRLIGATKFYIPKAFTGIFILIQFVSELIKSGFYTAIQNMGMRIFSAEYIINQNVTLAITDPITFNFVNFLEILNAFFVIYFFIKYMTIFIERSFSLNKNYMAYIWSIAIYCIIEFVVILIYSGYGITYIPINALDLEAPVLKIAFIPFVDGLWYLIMNYQAVLGAVDWFWLKQIGFR